MYEIRTFKNDELMEIFEFETLKEARSMFRTLRKIHYGRAHATPHHFWSIKTKGFHVS